MSGHATLRDEWAFAFACGIGSFLGRVFSLIIIAAVFLLVFSGSPISPLIIQHVIPQTHRHRHQLDHEADHLHP